jgi:hypothetical protein
LDHGISAVDEPKMTRGFSFQMISDKELEAQQKAMIGEVEETLGVSSAIARALLLKYQWDKNTVF